MDPLLKSYIKREQCRAFCNFVAKHIDKPWDFLNLALNRNVTEDFFAKYPDKRWYWFLSHNPNITWDFVKNRPDKTWDYKELSSHSNITWDIVKDNPDIEWDYCLLSKNPNITWEIVQNNPDKDWDYSAMSSNPNITWEIVQANPDKDWNYSLLSSRSFITWEIVKQNTRRGWCYMNLYRNPSIEWDMNKCKAIGANMCIFFRHCPNIADIFQHGPVDYRDLSENLNITYELIEKNIDKPWAFDKLSYNHMTRQNQLIEERCIREYFAAKRIKRVFLKAFWAPDTYLGKKRLERCYSKEDYSVW